MFVKGQKEITYQGTGGHLRLGIFPTPMTQDTVTFVHPSPDSEVEPCM